MSETVTQTEALVLPSIGGPLVRDTVQLTDLQPDEAIIEIHASGICHTDILCMNGVIPVFTPAVLGHEGAGIVIAKGSNISHVSVGDKVILSVSSCRECANCSAGHPNYCDEGMKRNFGGRRPDNSTTFVQSVGNRVIEVFSSFFGQSSFSRHALVNGSSVVKVPQETNLELFAPLGCGVSTGVGAVFNTLDVKAGSSVAVFGVGTVGLSAVMAARLREAKYIIAIDLDEERLKLAAQVGATHTITTRIGEEVTEKIKASLSADGVAYALDTTGSATAIETMLASLATRGRAAQVGLPSGIDTVSVKVMPHLLRGHEYVGCAGGDIIPGRMLPYLIEQQQKGELQLEKIITYYKAEDFAQAFADFKSGKAIKAVLLWK